MTYAGHGRSGSTMGRRLRYHSPEGVLMRKAPLHGSAQMFSNRSKPERLVSITRALWQVIPLPPVVLHLEAASLLAVDGCRCISVRARVRVMLEGSYLPAETYKLAESFPCARTAFKYCNGLSRSAAEDFFRKGVYFGHGR